MLSPIISDYKAMEPKRKLETVLSSSNKATLSVAEAMLNDTSISYVIVANNSNDGEVTDIQVSAEDVVKARQILHELEEVDF